MGSVQYVGLLTVSARESVIITTRYLPVIPAGEQHGAQIKHGENERGEYQSITTFWTNMPGGRRYEADHCAGGR